MRGSLVRVVHLGFGWIDLSTTVLGVETSEFWHLVLSTLRTRISLFFVLISPVCRIRPIREFSAFNILVSKSIRIKRTPDDAMLISQLWSAPPNRSTDLLVPNHVCLSLPSLFLPKGPRWQPLHLCRALLVLQCWLATGVHKLFGTIRNKTTPTWIRPRFFILFLFPS